MMQDEEHTDRVTRLDIEEQEAADHLRRVPLAATEVEEQEALRRMLDRLPSSGETMEVRSGTTCIRIGGDGGRTLLAIHSDGRVEGEAADASAAAWVFAREVLGIRASADRDTPPAPSAAGTKYTDLVTEVRDLFATGWCICRSATLGDRVLEALEFADRYNAQLLGMVEAANVKYVKDMDILFLARKAAERELAEARAEIEKSSLYDLRAYLAKTLSNIEGTNHPWSVVDVRAFIQDALALEDEDSEQTP
jgi:hypothetical protein